MCLQDNRREPNQGKHRAPFSFTSEHTSPSPSNEPDLHTKSLLFLTVTMDFSWLFKQTVLRKEMPLRKLLDDNVEVKLLKTVL